MADVREIKTDYEIVCLYVGGTWMWVHRGTHTYPHPCMQKLGVHMLSQEAVTSTGIR